MLKTQKEIFEAFNIRKEISKDEALVASALLAASTIDDYKPIPYPIRPFEVHNYIEARLKGSIEYDQLLAQANGKWLEDIRLCGRENRKWYDNIKDDPGYLKAVGHFNEAEIITDCIDQHHLNKFPKKEYLRSVACQAFDSEHERRLGHQKSKESRSNSLIHDYEDQYNDFE